MGLAGILRYCLNAACLAVPATALYALLVCLRGRRPRLRGLAAVFYLAALFEITVLRSGVDVQAVLHAARPAVQWVPLKTTLGEARQGLWPLVYHVLGNLAWFVPLGMLLGRRRPWRALAVGAATSAVIEALQYALLTGVTDIDDLLLNALGALTGWALARAWKQLRKAGRTRD